MRIDRLTLERYGSISDRTLMFRPDAGLHVIVGANESGKTTMLNAIADLLFGFGHQTPYDFLHDVKTLRIGAELGLVNGRKLSFRRRKGTKNTLIDASDRPLADDLLFPVTGNMSRDTFCSEFGLTAKALRDGGHELLRAGGQLADTLAASSAGLTALSQLRERLNTEADNLFTPRKSSGKAFYVAAERHDQADRDLRAAVVTADSLQTAEAAVDAAKLEVTSLTKEHGSAGSELARLQRCVRTRTTVAKLQSLNQDLQSYVDLPKLTIQTVADWRSALDDYQNALENFRKLNESDAHDTAAVDALSVNEAILSNGDSIDALRERIGAVRKAIEDLPKRREAQRGAQVELDEWARRLGLATRDVMLARRPADTALARVRELAETRKRAEERLGEEEKRHRAAIQERDQLAAEGGNAVLPTDPAVFRQRLDAVSSIPVDAERLRRETTECELEHRALEVVALSLKPSVDNYEKLARFSFPGEGEISTHVQSADELSKLQLKLNSDRDATERKIGETTSEIERLTQEGIRVTKADLHSARSNRNSGFEKLRSSLDGDATVRFGHFGEVLSLSQAVDSVTDQLLNDTDRAALRQAAEDRLVEARKQLHELSQAQETLASRVTQLDAAWHALWQPTGIMPRTPVDMIQWQRNVATIVERQNKLGTKRTLTNAIVAKLGEARGALVKLMEDYGRKPDAALAPDILYLEANTWLGSLQEAWTEARELEIMRKAANNKVQEAEGNLNVARALVAECINAWPAAVQAIELGSGASVVEVEAALLAWQKVGEPKQSLDRESRSVEGIESDITSFNGDVRAVCERVWPSFVMDNAQNAETSLALSLTEARRAADIRTGLRKAMRERETDRAGLMARRNELATVFAEACKLLNLADTGLLQNAVAQLEKRQDLETEQVNLRGSLTEIADGFDETALRAEQINVDVDLLPGEIERLKLRQKELLEGITGASTKVAQAQGERDTLVKGRDAVGAARERAEASAELLTIARCWITMATGAKLATLAIERHRATVQDPLISRAGELFRVATAQSFHGLAADYDQADSVALVAVRSNGEKVAISGLSEGTADQLFLSLRLALLELRTAEPLPFIADDILTSFDEPRTRHILELLSQFGQRSQVIVFTHHAHVAELAQRYVSQVDVISL